MVAALAAGALVGGAWLGAIGLGVLDDRTPRGWERHSIGPAASVAAPQDWLVTSFEDARGSETDGLAEDLDAGRCARPDAPGVLLIEAGLWDACPEQAQPPRLVAAWGLPGVDPARLAEAERTEVAGEPARRLDDPEVAAPEGVRVPGEAVVVPALEASLLIRDEVPGEVAERAADSLARDGGPDDDLARVAVGSSPQDPDAEAFWVVDAHARVYPLADPIEEDVAFWEHWPGTTTHAVAHAWVTDQGIRVAAGGPDREPTEVLAQDGEIGPAAWDQDGNTLVWLADDPGVGPEEGGRMLVLARWGDADRVAEGDEPVLQHHRAAALPADLDLDRVALGIYDADDPDTPDVTGDASGEVVWLRSTGDDLERDRVLELRRDEHGLRVPDGARFVPAE